MSKASAAKKARRKRRLVARNERWLPPDVHADIEGVAQIANQIIPRGWEFDRDFSTEDYLTWYYPPSAIEVDDDDETTEAVTRIWVSDPEEPHVILVGAGGGDAVLTVEKLFERLELIEAYRAGEAEPGLA
ncbi:MULTISPECIES: hypothetical protein [unclassified Mycobacterium]|uniref:hypothetical protein n=1 Tax=unclassified Mycobacterium TaxID=2642494 RepID=UPI0029C8E20E|nr:MULTISPECIES: hypothetical protein [unclassified Mycobacterium]